MQSQQQFECLIIGSGEAGKNMAWAMGKAGRGTAVVELKLIGGSCPNIACLPSKNVIHGAKVADLTRHGADFVVLSDNVRIEMAGVCARKQKMRIRCAV